MSTPPPDPALAEMTLAEVKRLSKRELFRRIEQNVIEIAGIRARMEGAALIEQDERASGMAHAIAMRERRNAMYRLQIKEIDRVTRAENARAEAEKQAAFAVEAKARKEANRAADDARGLVFSHCFVNVCKEQMTGAQFTAIVEEVNCRMAKADAAR